MTVQERRIPWPLDPEKERFTPMKSRSKKRAPKIVNLTVKRRYLTEREVERLMDCAGKHGRYGHRDASMILVAYRHGLRASEVCDLQWRQIELSEGRLHVHRVKNGIPSVHPIRGDEMRALRKLRRDYPKDVVGELEPTGMAKHVWVDREWHLGGLADALDEAVETDGADWSAPLGNEDVGVFGVIAS